jgi:hypothetical protein
MNFLRVSLLVALVLVLSSATYGKPVKNEIRFEYFLDFSPIKTAPGILNCKIKVVSQTSGKDTFQGGITVNGSVTESTAEDMMLALKLLYEGQNWEVKQIGKSELHVMGKKDRRVEKIEVQAEGLAKEFHPRIKKVEKK